MIYHEGHEEELRKKQNLAHFSKNLRDLRGFN